MLACTNRFHWTHSCLQLVDVCRARPLRTNDFPLTFAMRNPWIGLQNLDVCRKKDFLKAHSVWSCFDIAMISPINSKSRSFAVLFITPLKFKIETQKMTIIWNTKIPGLKKKHTHHSHSSSINFQLSTSCLPCLCRWLLKESAKGSGFQDSSEKRRFRLGSPILKVGVTSPKKLTSHGPENEPTAFFVQ